MKTLEQIKTEYKFQAFDGRDLDRLVQFFTESELVQLGLELKPEYVGKHVAKPFTKEAVMVQLARDLDFAFEKALNKRGISASLMHEVIKMWNWVLEDGLDASADSNYAQYGLPHLKATALFLGLSNPIGDDAGDEFKYSSDC